MSVVVAPALYGAPSIVAGVDERELDIIRELFMVWQQKHQRNVLRSVYFEGKMPLKPSANVPQEALRRVEAVLGWPEKAVSVLAERSVFEGFVSEDGKADPFDLSRDLDDNRFDIELPQAIEAAYEYSSSFITTALGDTAAGEPKVLVLSRSAEWSAAIWDERRRGIKYFLAVTDTDKASGQPTAFDVYLPEAVLSLTRRPSGSWVAERRPNPLGDVLVEALPYAPTLKRPFGRSRISRPVMNITDRALMNIVRGEISGDFYMAPRMYALGVTEAAFAGKSKWDVALDRWFAITRDENGDIPTVGQFPQMTMQPFTEQFKLYATQFSGETGVPVSNLGIITDNPPSAEALYADDRRLVSVALRQNRIFGSSLKRVGQRIVRLRDGIALTDELRGISVSWANPAFTSPATSADALVKLATVFPWLSESEVALEFAGFSRAEIKRLAEDKRRSANRSLLSALVPQSSEQPVPEQMVPAQVAATTEGAPAV